MLSSFGPPSLGLCTCSPFTILRVTAVWLLPIHLRITPQFLPGLIIHRLWLSFMFRILIFHRKCGRDIKRGSFCSSSCSSSSSRFLVASLALFDFTSKTTPISLPPNSIFRLGSMVSPSFLVKVSAVAASKASFVSNSTKADPFGTRVPYFWETCKFLHVSCFRVANFHVRT